MLGNCEIAFHWSKTRHRKFYDRSLSLLKTVYARSAGGRHWVEVDWRIFVEEATQLAEQIYQEGISDGHRQFESEEMVDALINRKVSEALARMKRFHETYKVTETYAEARERVKAGALAKAGMVLLEVTPFPPGAKSEPASLTTSVEDVR